MERKWNNKNFEYAVLTNEIYQAWSGMKASEYKNFKGIRKESLRDNMTDIEVALTDLGEIATRELAKSIDLMAWKKTKKSHIWVVMLQKLQEMI